MSCGSWVSKRRAICVDARFLDCSQIFTLEAPVRFPYVHLTQNGCGRSSGVEHNLAKVRVVSSNLIARSN